MITRMVSDSQPSTPSSREPVATPVQQMVSTDGCDFVYQRDFRFFLRPVYGAQLCRHFQPASAAADNHDLLMVKVNVTPLNLLTNC